MQNELKPCPFCGGEANIDCGNGIYTVFYVFCKKCKTRQPNRLTMEDAIFYWNTRTHQAEQKLKEMRVENGKIY